MACGARSIGWMRPASPLRGAGLLLTRVHRWGAAFERAAAPTPASAAPAPASRLLLPAGSGLVRTPDGSGNEPGQASGAPATLDGLRRRLRVRDRDPLEEVGQPFVQRPLHMLARRPRRGGPYARPVGEDRFFGLVAFDDRLRIEGIHRITHLVEC